MAKNIWELDIEDIVKAGLNLEEAVEFNKTMHNAVLVAIRSDPRDIWRELMARIYGLHQLVYYSVYANWNFSSNGPPLYWFPSLHQSNLTNLGKIMELHGPKLLGASYKDPISSFSLFQKFSSQNPEIYWSIVLDELCVTFQNAPRCILDTIEKSKRRWLPDSILNFKLLWLESVKFIDSNNNNLQ